MKLLIVDVYGSLSGLGFRDCWSVLLFSSLYAASVGLSKVAKDPSM